MNLLSFTPYNGSKISLYDGTRWKLYTFSETALTLTATSANNYDIFMYDNSGTLTLEASTAWTSDTARANTANDLTPQDGIYVKKSATGRRYLGTFRASAANTTKDTEASRLLWNYYQQARKKLSAAASTTTWTYTSAAWRQAAGSTANQVELVVGGGQTSAAAYLPEAQISISVLAGVNVGNSGSTCYAGLCEDCTNNATDVSVFMSRSQVVQLSPILIRTPAIGYHYYAWTEYGSTSTCTTSGNTAASFGIRGWVEN